MFYHVVQGSQLGITFPRQTLDVLMPRKLVVNLESQDSDTILRFNNTACYADLDPPNFFKIVRASNDNAFSF